MWGPSKFKIRGFNSARSGSDSVLRSLDDGRVVLRTELYGDRRPGRAYFRNIETGRLNQ